ncbi:Hypothetical predicted protein [Mytilus galloprovincialis]|uniref:Reverse transcriptase domain-containing protein n=1 Tax=Mytilus galloprovincialis TaxID=29158 RepID=A0A8B6HL19_MYTGA|nr:Hypothetical predicted protein [Mytilus galloprovincialis]
MSSLLISESRYEIKKPTENFFISVLDVQSAFDVVQHIILMDKAMNQNMHPTYWKILTELYEGLTSKVKWMDGLSEPFKIKQGVRQGGILSTHLYKIFVQDLLVELEQNSLGYHLGDIYVGAPTCADDIAFISNNEYELQVMLNVIDRYAKEHHYKNTSYQNRNNRLFKASTTFNKIKYIEELEIFHRKNLRHLQSLPERTSNAVVLLLLGALPIEAEIHKRHLSLLYSILSCDNSKIKDVMIRQIATNYDNKKSFFSRILNILEMYDLPSINYLQKNLPKRDIWKEEIKKKVNQYWNAQLKSEARNKTSLKNMNIENLEIGKTAQVWNLQNQPRLELRKAIIKARMMTGAYILQSDKHKFTHFVAEPLCQLCNTENEDIIHMVTSCPVLSTIREKYYVEMKMEILDNIDPIKWNTFCCNKMEITQLILDCNNFKETLNISSELMTKIEEKCRNLLFQLHAKRIEVLDALNNK